MQGSTSSSQIPMEESKSSVKWMIPKFDFKLELNSQILKKSSMAPSNSNVLSRHVLEELIPRSHLKMESPDYICYNEW